MRNMSRALAIIVMNKRFGEMFFVNSFGEYDKRINFSSEQCVFDSKNVFARYKCSKIPLYYQLW